MNVSPAGNPGEIEYVNVPVPPAPVTGRNELALPAVSVVAGTASVTTSAGGTTARLNTREAVCPAASVTVTVRFVAAAMTVGVPLICPVAVLKTNPAGKGVESA